MSGNPLANVDPFGLAAITIPVPDAPTWLPGWVKPMLSKATFWLTILTIPGDTPITNRCSCDGVPLYKSPTKPQLDIINQFGFRAQDFPGEGIFFATTPDVAAEYASARGTGVFRLTVKPEVYASLVAAELLVPDPLLKNSVVVRPNGITPLIMGSKIEYIDPNSTEFYDCFIK